MQNKNSYIFGFAINLLKIYLENQKKYGQNLYRIISIENDSTNSPRLVIQVIGKANIFEMSAKDILADDQITEGFSKRDIRTITYLASKTENIFAEYKIIEQKLEDATNIVFYKLKSKNNNNIITRTAKEILNDPQLMKKLDPNDSLKIGYVFGVESILQERYDILDANNNITE